MTFRYLNQFSNCLCISKSENNMYTIRHLKCSNLLLLLFFFSFLSLFFFFLYIIKIVLFFSSIYFLNHLSMKKLYWKRASLNSPLCQYFKMYLKHINIPAALTYCVIYSGWNEYQGKQYFIILWKRSLPI